MQETRLWDADAGCTESMRSKEEAHDYRYFPEPDLPPLRIADADLARWQAELPELPEAMRERLVAQYGLPAYDAGVLTQSAALARFFERTAAAAGQSEGGEQLDHGRAAAAAARLGRRRRRADHGDAGRRSAR